MKMPLAVVYYLFSVLRFIGTRAVGLKGDKAIRIYERKDVGLLSGPLSVFC